MIYVLRRPTRAIALISVLLFCSIFLMMVGGIVARVRMSSYFSLQGRDELAAQAAAEAGLARALCELSHNKAWAGNLAHQRLDGAQSSYTLQWDGSHSINNLANDTAAAGPNGPASVPPHSAYVVVEGSAGPRTCRLEAVVTTSGLIINSPALATTGNISFGNDIDVRGVRSLDDSSPIPASIVSTKSSAESGIISWSGMGTAKIKGSVLSNGANASAISSNLNAAVVSGSVKAQQSASPPARIDITSRVAAKNGAPTPTLSGTSQTLGGGDFYFPGGVNYNGDLELNGSNLYVQGNFQINGSIRGKGSVFVTGASGFSGDAEIKAGDNQQIAVYSKGDVTLSGFNGTATLNSLATAVGNDAQGVPYSTHIDNMKLWTSRMQDIQEQAAGLLAASPSAALPNAAQTYTGVAGTPKIFGNDASGGSYTSDFDYYTDIMGFDVGDNAYRGIPLESKYTGVVPKLHQLVKDHATAGPTRDFLMKKLASLRDPDDTNKGILGHHTDDGDIEADLNAVLSSGTTEGLFDALNDYWWNSSYLTHARRRGLLSALGGTLQQLDFNRLGSSYFRGLVYTEGNLRAQNDVTVVGSLVGVGPASNLELDNSVQVLYVPEISRRAGETLGVVSVKSWLRR
ncbi:MAG: hypothetical protein KF760_27640 [Candidatus Eremiobacteraeota bacterium]|nr:hypothetical protein [Candidatus Eremiobacteraeota bacterium]MCW5871047.1 hypothetical protein [Candidatus Eremiobacteraeota bacterium]